MQVFDFFYAAPPAQIRIDHIALQRPGANERDFDCKIVKGSRFEARQCVHLRTALHLKNGHRVGAAEIVVHRLIGHLELSEVDRHAAGDANVFDAVLEHREHPETEKIDLHEPRCIEIIFFPLDDRAVVHRRRFDRHYGVQRLVGEHESADMNAALPRRFAKSGDDGREMLHARVVRIESGHSGCCHRCRRCGPVVKRFQYFDLFR